MGFRVKVNIMNLMYYPIFMFRRLSYAATIVLLYDYPEIQLAFINIGTIAFAGYMIYWKPFKNKFSLYSAASSELFFAFFTTLLYTFKIPQSDYASMILGWTLISTVLVSLVTSWVCVILQQVQTWQRILKLKEEKAKGLILNNNVSKTVFEANDKSSHTIHQSKFKTQISDNYLGTSNFESNSPSKLKNRISENADSSVIENIKGN